MDLRPTGKTALVAGSPAGTGLAIAHSLTREGARVWINGRSSERVEKALLTIREGYLEHRWRELSLILVRVMARGA